MNYVYFIMTTYYIPKPIIYYNEFELRSLKKVIYNILYSVTI